jgi:predicted transcriptional regulator of viral defense system
VSSFDEISHAALGFVHEVEKVLIIVHNVSYYVTINTWSIKMSQARSLGKSSSRLLMSLAENDKNVFTFQDAASILNNKSDAAIRKMLSDLMKKKWILQLNRGRYLVVPLSAGEKAEISENWYLIAKYLIEPHQYYLSHYSAMEIHKMTTQPISKVLVSTPQRKKDVSALGALFHFVYLTPSRIWGLTTDWATPSEKVQVSDLERTIIDCLNNPRLCGGLSEVAQGVYSRRSDFDSAKLLEYVERFGSNAIVKRLGFLMELFDLDPGAVDRLRRMLNTSYSLLDPSLPPGGKYRSRWRLRMNIDPVELKEAVGS